MLPRFIGRVGINLLAAALPITLPAQGRVPDPDWRSYNRTVAEDRFSPLTEISRANVGQLREVCHYALGYHVHDGAYLCCPAARCAAHIRRPCGAGRSAHRPDAEALGTRDGHDDAALHEARS